MSSPLPVKVTPRARREIRQASSWWAEHRTKAAHAFREDVQRAFDTLARQPLIGSPATNIIPARVRNVDTDTLVDLEGSGPVSIPIETGPGDVVRMSASPEKPHLFNEEGVSFPRLTTLKQAS